MKIHTHPIILSILLFCFAAGAFFVGHMALSYATFQATENFCVLLDAGHGGADPGKVSASGIKEKDINLSISNVISDKLTKLGAIVYLTRYDDYDLAITNTINRKRSDLSRRGNIINRSNCDIFLSIHLNAEETGIWSGAQVFYNNENKENEVLAKLLQKNFNKRLNSNRDYKLANDLYLQKRVDRPGVLIEVGFLSNASDRYLLKQASYQNKVAVVVTDSIVEYFLQK